MALEFTHKPKIGDKKLPADMGPSDEADAATSDQTAYNRRPISADAIRMGWYYLLILTLTNVIMSVDRVLPQMLAEPIKREFSLSDAQLGIFVGTIFGISYGAAALILGPLIDRVNRVRYLGIIVALWSAMTTLTGLASSYILLLFARAGLGAGEASGNPTSLSLIGDLFPPERRAFAMGIYKMGPPLGGLFASLLVAYVAATYGWRAVFFFAGIPGFVLAISIALLLREPSRGTMERGLPPTTPRNYAFALRFVFANRRILPLAFAIFLITFSGASVNAFIAPFLQRYHGLDLKQVGLYLALGSAISAASPVLMGYLADRLVNDGQQRVFIFLAALLTLTGLLVAATLTVTGMGLVLAAFLGWQFFLMGLTAPSMSALVSLTPANIRGTVLSLVNATMFAGFALGPMVVGLLSDFIGGASGLREAMTLVGTTGSIGSAALFLLCARNNPRSSLQQ